MHLDSAASTSGHKRSSKSAQIQNHVQAMDRILAVIEAGALPALTALSVGPPGAAPAARGKADQSSSDKDALQLEALVCLR